MSYATDREYTKTERAIVLTEYILEHGSVTNDEAMKLTGCSYMQLWRLLRDIDRILCTYKDGDRRVLLE